MLRNRTTRVTEYFKNKMPIDCREYSTDQEQLILEVKQKFKQCSKKEQILLLNTHFPELTQFLDILSYDLSQDLIKYKVSKYRNTLNKGWITLESKQEDYVNVITDQFNSKTKESYQTSTWQSKSSFIFDHIFCDVNRTEYYRSSIASMLDSKEEAKNIHKINSISGGSLHDSSNVLVIDIDNHDNSCSLQMQNIYDEIIRYFNIENVIYQEKSQDFGYHIYIKLDKKLNSFQKKQLLKNLLKDTLQDKSKIQIPSRIRFPLSYTYTPIDNKDYIGSNYETNIFNVFNSTIEKYNSSIGYDVSEFKQIKQHKPNAIYVREKNSKYNLSDKEKVLQDFMNDSSFDLYAGDRNRLLPYFVRISKILDYNEQQCFDLCISKNINSKDLGSLKGIKQVKREIASFYKSFNENSIKNCNDSEKLLSNIEFLPKEVQNMFDVKIISSIIINCGNKVTDLNIQKYKIVLLEILGKFYYNLDNKKLLKNSRDNKKYLIGEQISKKQCNLIKQKYKELEFCNVYNLASLILLKSGLFKQYKADKLGYFYDPLQPEYSRCRQFTLFGNLKNSIEFNSYNLFLQICLSFKNLYSKIKLFLKQVVSSSSITYNNIIKYIVDIFSNRSVKYYNELSIFYEKLLYES